MNTTPHYHSRKYSRLIEWIATNDNDGAAEGVEELKGYLTVKLVADCYDLKPQYVAEDVAAVRQRTAGVMR